MTRRRTLQSVLHNFLGTYTSRNNDYDGYWLFGLLLPQLATLDCDLKHYQQPATDLEHIACQRAVAAFSDQMTKARVPDVWVREATLHVDRGAQSSAVINGHKRAGHNVLFLVRAVVDTSRVYESRTMIFVAPHNTSLEYRSARRR